MTSSLSKVRGDWRVRLAGVLTLALLVAVVVISLKPDTDEDRFRQMRGAEDRFSSLYSGKWRWLNRASKLVSSRSLAERQFCRYDELRRQLEESGFIVRTEVPIPGFRNIIAVPSDPYSRQVVSKMFFRAEQLNLYLTLSGVHGAGQIGFICPKRDVDGWRLFLSNLATNDSPAID
jgi:hypothetical protein